MKLVITIHVVYGIGIVITLIEDSRSVNKNRLNHNKLHQATIFDRRGKPNFQKEKLSSQVCHKESNAGFLGHRVSDKLHNFFKEHLIISV